MSKIFNKFTKGSSGQKQNTGSESNQEQSFSIQPHPARTNDPKDLQGTTSDLYTTTGAGDPLAAFKANPGPVIPPNGSNLPPAASREEMRARAAELNREQ